MKVALRMKFNGTPYIQILGDGKSDNPTLQDDIEHIFFNQFFKHGGTVVLPNNNHEAEIHLVPDESPAKSCENPYSHKKEPFTPEDEREGLSKSKYVSNAYCAELSEFSKGLKKSDYDTPAELDDLEDER